ncbi:hypothetical protein BgiMline_007799 [Biomphalaria glabrata]
MTVYMVRIQCRRNDIGVTKVKDWQSNVAPFLSHLTFETSSHRVPPLCVNAFAEIREPKRTTCAGKREGDWGAVMEAGRSVSTGVQEIEEARTQNNNSPLYEDRTEIGPDRTEIGPDRTEIGPDRIEIGPDRTEIGPDRTEIGPDRIEIGPDRTEIGPDRTEIGPDRTEIGPDRTEIGPDRTEIGPDRTEIGPDRTEIGPDRTEIVIA